MRKDSPKDSDHGPFGVLDFLSWNHDWNHFHYPPEQIARAAHLMKEAGVDFIRMDFLWSDLEPSAGRFEFSRYEHLIDILSRHDLRLLGLLHYNSAWSDRSWNGAPDVQAFKYYALQVVKHFGGVVKHWEIWNEPDHPLYWQPQDGMQAYSKLLKSVYPILKQEDPECTVVLGGLSKVVPDSLSQIYTLAGRDSFDIVNIHPFVSPLESHAVSELRKLHQTTRHIMEHHGDAKKPIWFTEIGCPGVRTGVESSNWWLGQNPTESQQAEWVRTIYSEVIRWEGVEKIFWAFFRDTPAHFKDGTDYFGLVRNDFSLKPSYQTYRSLACSKQTLNVKS